MVGPFASESEFKAELTMVLKKAATTFDGVQLIAWAERAEYLIMILNTVESNAWNPDHDQNTKCARETCGHHYYRHWDPFETPPRPWCKSCPCDTFIEPTVEGDTSE